MSTKKILNFDDIPFEVVWDPELLLPGIYSGKIELSHCDWKWGNLASDSALTFLAYAARNIGGPIVEIGTFEGRTTINMALNLMDSYILTIDLGSESADKSHAESKTYASYTPGKFIREADAETRNKVRCVIHDSTTYDFSSLKGLARVFVIDGGHSHSVLARDTENAFASLAPGGIIVWDDYGPRWPEVMGYIDDLGRSKKLYYLARQNLVLYIHPSTKK